MADIFDQASDREALDRDAALQRQREKIARQREKKSATHCEVCEAKIPKKRREAIPGVQTCVLCQSDLEHAANQFNRY